MDEQGKYHRPTNEPALESDPAIDPNKEQIRAFADFIAKLLDSAFLIPGTRIRIGLDPLLGLIPGLGDVVSSLIGSSILFLATKIQVPKIILVRMAMNVGINTIFGAIPGIGDIFSIWFRSNERNAQLLRRYTAQTVPHSTSSDWLFVIGLIVFMLTFIGGVFTLVILGIRTIWNLGIP